MTRRLPTPLSERLAGASAALYSRQGREFDLALGGIPFMRANTPDTPETIETIKVQKQQFDTEDPGEQSLTGWWRRSQASFHYGAGFTYAEDSTQGVDTPGFHDSEGIDVFTVGRITLLRRMQQATTAALTYSRIGSSSSGFSAVAGGALHTAPAASGTFAALHSPAGKTIVDGIVSGSSFYDVASDGTLYEGLLSSPGTATSWPLGDTASRLLWGKHRLWVIGGRKIWQPDTSDAAGTAQTPIFTNPDLGWTYTCMAEGPSAMFFGGHDGYHSSIQAITFSADGGIPTLTGAAVTAVLPNGELVQEIACLGGQYIGIGTSRGFRVGVVNPDSSITYGPLLLSPEGVVKCSALTTQDRFFVVAFLTASDGAVAYRVDTGTQISDGVFPYARDIRCDAGDSITSMTAPGDSLVVTTGDGGVWYQSPTEYVDSGWLESGRIRFRTNEPKSFRFLELSADPLMGAIACQVVKEGGSLLPIGNFTRQGEIPTEALKINGPPMREAAVRLTLTPDTDKTSAPVIRSYLLRALPAVAPQRMITVPVLCFDREQSRSGQVYGSQTYAEDRLTALMLLEDDATELTYQNFNGIAGDHRVVIESLRFVATQPPSGGGGNGGILILELRTVDR